MTTVLLSGCVSQEVQEPSDTEPEESVPPEADACADSGNKDLCYRNLAESEDNTEACEKIERQTLKEACYAAIYTNRAKNQMDESLCGEIDYRPSKNTCFAELAILKEDMAVCESVEDQQVKDTCYNHFAEAMQDESICLEKVQTQTWKDICYNLVGIAKNDPAICELAGTQKDYCLSQIGESS